MALFKINVNPIDGTTKLYDGTEAKTITVNNGGTGYAVGDLVTLNGQASGGNPAILKVTSVSSGVVTGISLLTYGFGYSLASALATTTVTGTGSGLTINLTVLQTLNCYFGHGNFGSDDNTGTRLSPFNTLTKLGTKGTSYYGVYAGNSTENPNISLKALIFGNESYINGIININAVNGIVYGAHCYSLGLNTVSLGYKCNVNYLISTSRTNLISDSFIENYKTPNGKALNCTIKNLYNYIYASTNNIIYNTIITNLVDLYRYSSQTTAYLLFKYCVFRKLTKWLWNGTEITITYGEDDTSYLEDVWNSLYDYATSLADGTNKTYFLLMLGASYLDCPIFYFDSSGNQTNKVIDDTLIPIFNRYSGTTIIDYTLNSNSNNEASTMGDPANNWTYIGAYRPNIAGQATDNPLTLGDIINVNEDGTDDTVTTPTMLYKDSTGRLYANNNSTQTRNRVRTNVLSYGRGVVPYGAQSNLRSSSNSGYLWGKYRIFDLHNHPQETLEVIPYDNLTTPSTTLGKFSMSFNGQTLLYKYLNTDTYVTFNNLADLGVSTNIDLNEYGDYIVTTADVESLTLSQLTALVTTSSINMKYCVCELNLNYYA